MSSAHITVRVVPRSVSLAGVLLLLYLVCIRIHMLVLLHSRWLEVRSGVFRIWEALKIKNVPQPTARSVAWHGMAWHTRRVGGRSAAFLFFLLRVFSGGTYCTWLYTIILLCRHKPVALFLHESPSHTIYSSHITGCIYTTSDITPQNRHDTTSSMHPAFYSEYILV